MRYRLTAKITIGTYTFVEADSKEEAIARAEGREVIVEPSFNAADQATETWVIDEADGEPYDIEADEA